MEKQGGKWGPLVILSALVSVQLAQSLTSEQLELLSTFFEVLGDNLALLALSPAKNAQCQNEAQES